MSTSSIEWTEATWNPIVGCSILTPGCINCYAMKMAARIEKISAEARSRGASHSPHYDGTTKSVNGKPVWTGKLAMAPDTILLQPLKRKKPTVYFVNSMGDLFHEDCPDEWIDRVFAVMALSPQHTFQVLTKRAARMRDYLTPDPEVSSDDPTTLSERVMSAAYDLLQGNEGFMERCRSAALSLADADPSVFYPLPNVWLGVSTERQKEADERIPLLLQTPAAIRFISAEPLLGPINLTKLRCNIGFGNDAHVDMVLDGLTGKSAAAWHGRKTSTEHGSQLGAKLDWVIVGGESGHDSRAMHPDWARSLQQQCAAAGVKFFFKQWGEWAPSTPEEAAGNPRSGWKALSGYPSVAKAAELYPESGAEYVAHVDKKAAGRLLDGVEYNEMPEAK